MLLSLKHFTKSRIYYIFTSNNSNTTFLIAFQKKIVINYDYNYTTSFFFIEKFVSLSWLLPLLSWKLPCFSFNFSLGFVHKSSNKGGERSLWLLDNFVQKSSKKQDILRKEGREGLKNLILEVLVRSSLKVCQKWLKKSTISLRRPLSTIFRSKKPELRPILYKHTCLRIKVLQLE